MIRSDLHVHTTFSDGVNTPEEVVLEAIRRGMETVGFSDHAYTPCDTSYCMQKSAQKAYFDTITALKEKYKGQITVKCGIERDVFFGEDDNVYDYAIGAAHYLCFGTEYVPVDLSADALRKAADGYYGGDMYAVAEKYYKTVESVIDKTNADVIGHFDLIAKFNEKERLFDEKHPRYVQAWQKAADKLLASGKVFEINTGAIARGYRTMPYPSQEIYAYLKAHGARFILSSDSHKKETLMFGFERYETLI